ncbi:cytochrome P450 [Nocardia sp. NPDC005998]|uniref:cytochrome P450 n=1 Tax=Nocardia sp. NPDC005998 TaxID=3156894 RepID=UPI0033B58129
MKDDARFSVDRRWPEFPQTSPGAQMRSARGGLLFGMDNPRHQYFRRMLIPEFTAKRIEPLRPTVQRVVDELLDGMAARPGPVDLVDAFAVRILSKVLCQMLGLPYEDHEFFRQNVKGRLTITTGEDKAKRDHDELTSYLGELFRRRELEPSDDLIGRLARDRINTGQLSREEAVGLIEVVIAGGYAATGGTIGLGTLLLLEHPEQIPVIRDGDAKEVAIAVEELIRYVNSTHLGRRRVALEEVEIGGVTIQPGEGLIAADALANRDPRMFDDPDALNLRRDPNPHLVFGIGTHHCFGAYLAKVVLETAFPSLFRRFPGLRLAVPMSELEFLPDATVYTVKEIPVLW